MKPRLMRFRLCCWPIKMEKMLQKNDFRIKVHKNFFGCNFAAFVVVVVILYLHMMALEK